MIRTTLTATALAVLLAPALAPAHVTVQPKTATAGSYAVQNIRVPNESDDAATTKIAVQMPPGFAGVSYQRVAGWEVEVDRSKLGTPVKTDDGEITEQVDQVTFTATGKGIAPGEFQDFPLSLKLPDAPGTLAFKAVQTYDDGEVVRWIGGPDAEKPAAQLKLEAEATTVSTEPVAVSTPAAAVVPEDDGDGLALAGLVLGALGLLAGLGALVTVRRRPAGR